MAVSTFALQHISTMWINGAQKVLNCLVGPLCVFGGALCLGPVVVDAKLVVGLLQWGGVWYHWFHHDLHLPPQDRVDNFQLKMIQALGLDLAILSFAQYHHSVWLGLWMTVACTFAMIFLNGYFVTRLFPAHAGEFSDEAPINIDSIYEDMSKPLVQLWLIFVLQSCMCILALYTSFSIYGEASVKLASWGASGILVVEDEASPFTDVGCFMFWVIGFLVQMGAYFQRGGDSQLGRTWRVERWMILSSQNNLEVFLPKTKTWRRVSGREIAVRDWLGFIVNTVYRDLIAFITPLVLLKSDSAMDVAQNALALSYITTLDDVSDTEVKFRRGHAHQD